MALTVQKRLELAGALSKVQPQLQRLHLVEKPKERHLLRNAALVGTIAAGAIVAVVVYRRRACRYGAVAGDRAPEQKTGADAPERFMVA